MQGHELYQATEQGLEQGLFDLGEELRCALSRKTNNDWKNSR